MKLVVLLSIVFALVGCDVAPPRIADWAVTIIPEHGLFTSHILCVTKDATVPKVFSTDITDYPIPLSGELLVDERGQYCDASYELTQSHLLIYMDVEVGVPSSEGSDSSGVQGSIWFSVSRDTRFEVSGTLDIDDTEAHASGSSLLVALAKSIDEPGDAPEDPKEIEMLWAFINADTADSLLSIVPPHGGEFEIEGSASGVLRADQLYRFYFVARLDTGVRSSPSIRGGIALGEIQIEFIDSGH